MPHQTANSSMVLSILDNDRKIRFKGLQSLTKTVNFKIPEPSTQ